MHQCPKTLGEHGCAECVRNRVYDKRVWCHRMDLESRCHDNNSFLTLTYDDDHLPAGGTLDPRHPELWRKSFRQEVGPFRYFFVGEYGEQSLRPHYHAAIFGVGPEAEELVRKTWKHGHVMLAELNIATIRYIAGYVTKKYKQNDEKHLERGVIPEFRTMSKGLGRGYIPSIADALDCSQGEQMLPDDVPTSLRLHGRNMPLGRYMRSKLREEVIYKNDPQAKMAQLLGAESLYNSSKSLTKHDEKMQTLFKNYENSSMSKKMTFLEYLKVTQKQKNLNSEATFKLSQKGTI